MIDYSNRCKNITLSFGTLFVFLFLIILCFRLGCLCCVNIWWLSKRLSFDGKFVNFYSTYEVAKKLIASWEMYMLWRLIWRYYSLAIFVASSPIVSNTCFVLKAVLEKAGISRYRRGDEIPLNISLPYDSLVEIVEHLKACLEIAMNRNFNWQNFLLYSDEYIPNLFLLCSLLDEGVSHIILQLLQYAICGSKSTSSSNSSGQKQEVRTQFIPYVSVANQSISWLISSLRIYSKISE